MKKFISWRRVSTKKQGRSGLGLEAQQEIITYFVNAEQGVLIADYVEVYTGTDLTGCTELKKAMEHAKSEDAILIIAKTDRFRNTIDALRCYDMMEGRIYFCDLPNTDKFTLTLFFALAEREALMVSIRTKAALRVLKDKGKKLGAKGVENIKMAQPASVAAKKENAKTNDNNVFIKKYIEAFEQRNNVVLGRSNMALYQQLADELNQLGQKTQTGLEWTKERIYAINIRIKNRYNITY